MASAARSPRKGLGRTPRGALAFALSAALVAVGGLTLSMAGPAVAEPPARGGGSAATSEPKVPNPNADDDAYKGGDCSLAGDDHSAVNGSPNEQDVPDCAPPPQPPAQPQPVTAVLPATIAEPVDLLPCGETITTDGLGRQPDVAVTRLNDADKTASNYCNPFPYELKSIPDGLRFVKPTGYPLSQFFVDVTWFRTWSEIGEVPTVDFEAIKGGYPVELSPCPAQLRDETGEVVGAIGATATELAALGIVDQDGLPSAGNPEDNGLTQFACIADTSTVFTPWSPSGTQWTVYQRLYLLGDVIFRG